MNVYIIYIIPKVLFYFDIDHGQNISVFLLFTSNRNLKKKKKYLNKI